MDEYTLVHKLMETFPRATFNVTRRNNNLRIHFKIADDCYTPSKWMLGNVLGIELKQIKVNFKNYDTLVSGKLFTLLGGVYL